MPASDFGCQTAALKRGTIHAVQQMCGSAPRFFNLLAPQAVSRMLVGPIYGPFELSGREDGIIQGLDGRFRWLLLTDSRVGDLTPKAMIVGSE